MGILGEAIEGALEDFGRVGYALLERVQDAREDLTGPCAAEGLGTEADLAGDDGGAEVALGLIVVGRDAAVVGPVVEAVWVFAENALDVPDARMTRLARGDLDDRLLETTGSSSEWFVRDRPGAQLDGLGEQGAVAWTKAWTSGSAGNSLPKSATSRPRCE